MAVSEKPTVLFVHGSWHTPAHFAPVRKIFEAAGFPTSCPLHPSINNLPSIGLKEDAQCIRDDLTRLVNQQGKEVIVIAHSYGGVVTTEAVDEAFSKAKREADGQRGGVIGLLFMCAFLLPKGLSLAGALGGELPPMVNVKENGMSTMSDPAHHFYHDLSKDEQDHWINELRESPVAGSFVPLSYASYLYHPTTYLYCENDHGLPFEVQKMMVKNICDSTGITIKTETCTASHSPFLSMPHRVLESVERMAARAAQREWL